MVLFFSLALFCYSVLFRATFPFANLSSTHVLVAFVFFVLLRSVRFRCVTVVVLVLYFLPSDDTNRTGH